MIYSAASWDTKLVAAIWSTRDTFDVYVPEDMHFAPAIRPPRTRQAKRYRPIWARYATTVSTNFFNALESPLSLSTVDSLEMSTIASLGGVRSARASGAKAFVLGRKTDSVRRTVSLDLNAS